MTHDQDLSARMSQAVEKFLVLFNRLRQETNEVPNNINWLSKEKSGLSSLCHDLDSSYAEIVRVQKRKNTKHTIVPSAFSENWDDYVTNWQQMVTEAARPEKARRAAELKAILKQVEEKAISEGQKREDFWKELMETVPLGGNFDPDIEHPGYIMDTIASTIHDIAEAGLFEDVLDENAVGAWSFFENTIGIDYSAIYERWREIPELLIPEHALHRDISPIFELYNEAVRAYLFGLTVASMAMCRALLEHVLKKHYHITGKNLEKTIAMAEVQYDHLKRLGLQEKRTQGNMILHEYENRSTGLDRVVVGFLQSLRQLVINIPFGNEAS
jgi:hypothetical protein